MMAERKSRFKRAQELLLATSVREIMSKPAITIDHNDDFSFVEELFVGKNIRHLPVVDGQKTLVGLITQRDLYKLISPRRIQGEELKFDKDKIIDGNTYYSREGLDSYILNVVMKKTPKCLTVNGTVGEAIHCMVKYKVGCVPIIDKQRKVIGIITRFDILKKTDQIYLKLLKAQK